MRRVAGILLFAALVGVVAFLFHRHRQDAPRFVQALAAVGDDQAVLLTRINGPGSTRTFVELVQADGPRRWSAETSPLLPHHALDFVAVAADATRVLVMASRGDTDVVLALDRTTGARLWQTELPGPAATGPHLGPTIFLDGPRAVFLRGPDHHVLDALALADGAHLWSYAPGAAVRLHLLAPDRLLVASDDVDAVTLDAAGEPTALGTLRVLCPTPLGLLAHVDGNPRLVTADKITTLDWNDERRATRGPCGVRGGHLIITTYGRHEHDTHIVRVDPATGIRLWYNYLWSDAILYDPFPAVVGELPRFVPFAVHSVDENRTSHELIVLDTDRDGNYRQYQFGTSPRIMIAGDTAAAWAPDHKLVVRIGQQLGQPISLTAFPGLASPVSASHHGDRLWLAGFDHADPDELPWVRFDLTAGTYLARPDLESRDADAKDWRSLGRF